MQDGWGLTSGKDHIVGSDGTANIYFMDPSTFKGKSIWNWCSHWTFEPWDEFLIGVIDEMHCAKYSCVGCSEIRKVVVKDNGQLVPNLNELEYIKDEIWANVYQVLSLFVKDVISCWFFIFYFFCWEHPGGYFACGECLLEYSYLCPWHRRQSVLQELHRKMGK